MTRPTILVGVAVAVFAGSLVTAVLRADDREGPITDSRARIGLAFARQQGIELNLTDRDPEIVGLGSYLVNAVGGCNDCHTAPPYTKDPFAFLGAPKQVNVACYLAGGQAFGPFVSRDITPFKNGKPAGLSFKAFQHVIRTGEDPLNPGMVLQVMPWPTFQTMTDADLHAIYVYLSSIPPIAADICGVPSE